MLAVARVAAVDTRADQLRIAHDLPVLPAVATLRCGPVELRILAASHQVVVDGAGDMVVETVACGRGVGEWLRDGQTVLARGATTAVEVERLVGDAFAAEVAAWRRRGRDDDRALVVEFPGRDAVTGLALDGAGWVSLHSYPGDGDGTAGGTVVRTRTVVGTREEAACRV